MTTETVVIYRQMLFWYHSVDCSIEVECGQKKAERIGWRPFVNGCVFCLVTCRAFLCSVGETGFAEFLLQIHIQRSLQT